MAGPTSSPNQPPEGQPEGQHGQRPFSAENSSPTDLVLSKVTRPFLKGTVTNSILIDITNVSDQKKLFLNEFQAYCEGNLHLWEVADQLLREYGRIYAEVTVSPFLHKQFVENPSFVLPSFAESFSAYPSLSSSAEIRKITFTGLPHQYGRRDGGVSQLTEDMKISLAPYGDLIDCGFVTGSSGYAVIAVPTSSNSTVKPLTHSVPWFYAPSDYASSTGEVSSTLEVVNILATWASMPPFCRYCHSESHALLYCQLRKKATICHLCHVPGHIAKFCPRKNNAGDSVGKRRKLPNTDIAVLSPPSPSALVAPITQSGSSDHIAPASLPVESQANTANDIAVALPVEEKRHRVESPARATRTTSALVDEPPKPVTVKPCKHCGLMGHKQTIHKDCLKNPQKLAEPTQDSDLYSPDFPDIEYVDMDLDTAQNEAVIHDIVDSPSPNGDFNEFY
ncbi:hypothetical protein INT47_003523 [Mucor saturninus]|uniref:CCHC-type domain-containing protein n=1 Tax=Mucor saturninus TaxID=64648 RepID=A0A8H7QJX5_9FUNG|nr:hypothetical protein INT47_003523 [Mucor saturninus]